MTFIGPSSRSLPSLRRSRSAFVSTMRLGSARSPSTASPCVCSSAPTRSRSPRLPAETSNQIQVEYQTTSGWRLFRENRTIAVPQPQAENLGFHWRVFLAPGIQPGGLSSGLRFGEPLPALSWAERLFGPLGRSAAQMRLSSFRPDAWIVDLAGGDPESEAWTPQERERPPAGWSIWEASAEAVSGDVSLTLWHEGKFRALAWIVCLGCAIAGLAVARLASRAMRRLGPLAIAGGVALALAAPSPYALLGGACVSGVILAVLMARPWKAAAAPSAPTEKRTLRPGSTVTFELRSLGVLFALATLSAMAAWAQETPRSAEPLPRTALSNPASTDAQHPQPASDGDVIVVVPVRPSRSASAKTFALPGDNELVYVSSNALDKLRRQSGAGSQNEGTSLLSSDYSIALDERQPAAINATFRVAVMPGPARSLLLRLGNVTLAGANACRVDGQPYPIRKDDEGFVLSLDPNVSPLGAAPSSSPARAGELRRPIAAERPSAATTSVTSNSLESAARPASGQPRFYEIHLTCFPNGEAKSGQFEIQIPEAAHTTLRIEKSGPWHAAVVGTGDGKHRGQCARAMRRAMWVQTRAFADQGRAGARGNNQRQHCGPGRAVSASEPGTRRNGLPRNVRPRERRSGEIHLVGSARRLRSNDGRHLPGRAALFKLDENPPSRRGRQCGRGIGPLGF